jgi:hypothetical protein
MTTVTALSLIECLVKHNIPVVSHSPYFPNLALHDFFPFCKLKAELEGDSDNKKDIIDNTSREFRAIMKKKFHTCSQTWQDHCEDTSKWMNSSSVEDLILCVSLHQSQNFRIGPCDVTYVSLENIASCKTSCTVYLMHYIVLFYAVALSA